MNLIMFLFCFPFQLLVFVSIFCLHYHRIWFSIYWISSLMFRGFPCGSDSKESTYNDEDLGLIPGLGRFSGRGMATHSGFLPGESPWTEEPGGLQSIGSQRVGHNWVTDTFTSFLWCFTLSEFFHKIQSFLHFLKILLNTRIPQILRMLERWCDNHSNLILREPHLSITNTQFNEIYV